MKKQLLFLLISLLSLTIYAQDYVLDSSFGESGHASINIENENNTPIKVLELEDGSLITLSNNNFYDNGNVSIYRLTKILASGEIDTSFGQDGFIDLDTSDNTVYFDNMILQNQKIIICGSIGQYPDRNFIMARYLLNGDLDLTFGDNGVVISTDVTNFSKTILLNNRIIKLTNTTIDDVNYLKIVSYNEDGSIYISFGDNGIATLLIDINHNIIKKIAVFNSQLFINIQTNQGSQSENYLVNVLDNGNLNTNFNTNGILNYYSSNAYTSTVFTIKNNGDILLALKNDTSYFLTQYNQNGDLDLDFGVDGIATNSLDYSNLMFEIGLSKLVVLDEHLYLFGFFGEEEGTSIFFHRYDINGGLAVTSFTSNTIYYQDKDVFFTNNNDLIVYGETYWYDGEQHIIISRFNKTILATSENQLRNFEFYPNPANNIIYVKFIKNKTNFSIVNLLGKELINGKLSNLKNIIDVSSLTNGVYFIQLDNTLYKFIKE